MAQRERGNEPGNTVVVIDEDAGVRSLAVGMLQRGGFDAVSFGTIEEGIATLARFAPARVTVLLSSTLAAAQRHAFQALLKSEARPRVVFSCTRCGVCPMHSGAGCETRACIVKPDDFTLERLCSGLKLPVLS